MEGVARIQYEKDVRACLDDIRSLVQHHGLSWEQDAFYEIEQIVLAALAHESTGS